MAYNVAHTVVYSGVAIKSQGKSQEYMAQPVSHFMYFEAVYFKVLLYLHEFVLVYAPSPSQKGKHLKP